MLGLGPTSSVGMTLLRRRRAG